MDGGGADQGTGAARLDVDGGPGQAHEHAVLGVREPGLAGAHREVLGVEAGDVVQQSGGADEVRGPVLVGGDTGGGQLLMSESAAALRHGRFVPVGRVLLAAVGCCAPADEPQEQARAQGDRESVEGGDHLER